MEAEWIADVSPEDLVSMGRKVVRLHVFEERGTRAAWKSQRSGPLQGSKACVCSALRGSVLSWVSCRIYDVRPEVCRTFERGSKRCLDARKEGESTIEDFRAKSVTGSEA